MRLRVFHAGDGDCLLLTTADGRHVLVDGGRTGTFQENARPQLAELAAAGEPIDLVVVSHIDADHIAGVISLLEEVAAWEVHDFQVGEGGNPGFPEPATPRPPTILGLWHNSWRAQLGDLEGPISALATRAAEAFSLATSEVEEQTGAAVVALDAISGLAESITDGVTLLRLVDDETPVVRNAAFDHGLVLLRTPVHEERVGSATLQVLGPAEKHLKKLREEWRAWLARHPAPARDAGAGPDSGTAGDGHETRSWPGRPRPQRPTPRRAPGPLRAPPAPARTAAEGRIACRPSSRPRGPPT